MGGGAGADFAPNLRRETISLTHLPPLGKPPPTWNKNVSLSSTSLHVENQVFYTPVRVATALHLKVREYEPD